MKFQKCFIFFLFLSLTPVWGQDRRFNFLDTYLNDPYCTIHQSDIGLEGNLYWNNPNPLFELTVAVRGIQWIDPGTDGRSDMVIPVYIKLSNKMGNSKLIYLIFHNEAKLMEFTIPGVGIVRTHWNPIPDTTSLMVNPPLLDGQLDLGNPILVNGSNFRYTPLQVDAFFSADLNGDGLLDEAIVAFPKAIPSFSGGYLNLLQFKEVKLNTGFGCVSESDIPNAIRDIRLGYIAS